MIIVQLTGGLGNQLFQYAMGRTLAINNNTELKLDLNFFKTYEWHEYSLAPFCIKENIASDEDIMGMNIRQSSFMSRVRRKLFNEQMILIHEKDLSFNIAYTHIKDPAYLFGYWQSEKYFVKYEEVIRQELQVRIPPSQKNLELLKQIQSTEAISLHIRRGNYVNVDFVNKSHGTCSMEYYEKAVAEIGSTCSQPVYYIFSDDIPWAKENLKLNYPCVFVDHNDDKTDYEDMRLMSACRHHIIANSTFSWWAAWLNDRKDKKVIAPQQWFADEKRNNETIDLIPKQWLRI